MPNVLNEYAGDGVTQTFNFSMTDGYLSRDYVVFQTRPNDSILGYEDYDRSRITWLTDFSVRTAEPIPVGTTFVITRATPAAALVDFQNTSRITERNLDTATRQSLHRTVETADYVARGVVGITELAEVAVAAAEDSAHAAELAASLVLSAEQAAASAANSASVAEGLAEAATNTADAALQLIGDAVNGSVSSFNGRGGTVLPEDGDYTPPQVGFALGGALSGNPVWGAVPAWANNTYGQNAAAQVLTNRTELLKQHTELLSQRADKSVLSYHDYTSASTAAATLPDGQVVEVLSDESRGGSTSRYIVETNQLVFTSSSSVEQSFTQTGVGAVLQTVSEKLQQTPTAKDFGVVADRVANDTLPISNAVARIGGVKPVAEVTAYTNDSYAPLTDVIVEMGSAVMNPQHDRTARVFGEEYLQAFHIKFSGENGLNTSNTVTGKTIVYSGDSTVLGVGANINRDPCTLLKYSAYGAGYAGVTVLNRGQSGKATVDWDSTFVASDIAANPDLLVLRWGVNDPYYGYTIDQFRAALRSGLGKVRAAKSISQTSIVLMTPCSTNDKATGRDEVWHERINGVIRQAARDFQCTFIDTYAYLQDSHNGASYMDTQGNGSHVHPLDILYEKINRILADVIFPPHYIYGRGNNFYNIEYSVATNSISSTDPKARVTGLTYERSNGDSGVDGQLITLRGPNQTAIQLAHPLPGVDTKKGLRARHWFNGNNLDGWLGANTGVTFANGWSNFGSPYAVGRVQSTLDGRAGLFGLIRTGITTAGTKLFSVPAWLAPISDELIKVHGELGDVFIKVSPNGDVTLPVSAASIGTYISLNGESWLID